MLGGSNEKQILGNSLIHWHLLVFPSGDVWFGRGIRHSAMVSGERQLLRLTVMCFNETFNTTLNRVKKQYKKIWYHSISPGPYLSMLQSHFHLYPPLLSPSPNMIQVKQASNQQALPRLFPPPPHKSITQKKLYKKHVSSNSKPRPTSTPYPRENYTRSTESLPPFYQKAGVMINKTKK